MKIIILVVVGISLLVYGLLVTFGFIKTKVPSLSEFDKKIASEKARYFIRRYDAGVRFIISGMAFILLGAVLYFS